MQQRGKGEFAQIVKADKPSGAKKTRAEKTARV
jgi:hypothetical protein